MLALGRAAEDRDDLALAAELYQQIVDGGPDTRVALRALLRLTLVHRALDRNEEAIADVDLFLAWFDAQFAGERPCGLRMNTREMMVELRAELRAR